MVYVRYYRAIMHYLYTYLATFAALTAIDFLWLGIIAKSFYAKHLGLFLRSEPLWVPIIIFYALYALAICVFAVFPAQGAFIKTMTLGAFLGFTVYMTFELVNYGLLNQWPLAVVVPDIAWGALVTALAALVGALIF